MFISFKKNKNIKNFKVLWGLWKRSIVPRCLLLSTNSIWWLSTIVLKTTSCFCRRSMHISFVFCVQIETSLSTPICKILNNRSMFCLLINHQTYNNDVIRKLKNVPIFKGPMTLICVQKKRIPCRESIICVNVLFVCVRACVYLKFESFFCWTQKMMFWRKLETVTIDFQSRENKWENDDRIKYIFVNYPFKA